MDAAMFNDMAAFFNIRMTGRAWHPLFVHSPMQRKHAAKAAHGAQRAGKVSPAL